MRIRIALATALAVVVATPVVADAPIDWLTRFAFLRAVDAKHLPPGPEAWKAFACVARAARPISDRNAAPLVRAQLVEADEAIAPCKDEINAIPQHAAKMQNVAVDLIAKFRADRPLQRP